MRIVVSLGLGLLLSAVCVADGLDDSIRQEMSREKLPGLTFAVVRHGKIIRLGSYGYGNLEWNSKATNDTRFEIASMSKMFTGAAIRILIEADELSEEDLVSKYLDGLPDAWKSMRVRHLIDMDMGLADDWGTDVIPYSADVTTSFDDRSMLKSFISTKPVAPLGAEFHYASQAYSMLGMIVNKISGEPLAQFVDEHCFKPAGMTQSSYIDNSAIIPERAQGYRHVNGATLHGWFLGQYLHARPDVGILSTSRDLAKWAIALEQGKIVRDPSKLWQWTVSDTGKPLDYSYGWFVGTDNGHLMYGHSGGFRTGFHTLIRRYPDDGIDIVTMTNTDDSEAATINEFIATKYISGWLSGVDLARKPDTNPQETAACINALKSLAVGKIDDAVMLPDALGPATISDTADFYKDQQTYTFSGRATLTHPMTVHGHRLERYTRITSAQGTRNHVTTLYWDDLGRIALVEPTS